jgi:formyltetrahydrofolate deformylase
MKNSAVLLIHCPDRKGIVAAIANFLLEQNANILHADQHQDAELGLFFMRIEWDLKGAKVSPDDFPKAFAPIAKQFGMQWKLQLRTKPLKVALFVSKYGHCLADILYRHKNGELDCTIPLVISNHPDLAPLVEFYETSYHHIPLTEKNKPAAEKAQLALLAQHDIDLVILARYMQVLSTSFVKEFPNRIINVHHSFLPAFSGAKPYHQAYERGVKLIGATSHYVTDILDDGPIIEQDVSRISHRDQIEDLVQKGSDLEKSVLSRALRWHIGHRILVYGKKTVVFD